MSREASLRHGSGRPSSAARLPVPILTVPIHPRGKDGSRKRLRILAGSISKSSPTTGATTKIFSLVVFCLFPLSGGRFGNDQGVVIETRRRMARVNHSFTNSFIQPLINQATIKSINQLGNQSTETSTNCLRGVRLSVRSINLQNLYCLQAHLENLWEAAAIKAARLLNNLDYLAGMRIATKVTAHNIFRVALLAYSCCYSYVTFRLASYSSLSISDKVCRNRGLRFLVRNRQVFFCPVFFRCGEESSRASVPEAKGPTTIGESQGVSVKPDQCALQKRKPKEGVGRRGGGEGGRQDEPFETRRIAQKGILK